MTQVNAKTVKQLKAEIPYSDAEKGKLPTAKALVNSDAAAVELMEFEPGHVLSVYDNGLVLYIKDKHYTVFRLHKVDDWYYSESEEAREPLPWHFHLMLVGDDRIFSNYDAKELKQKFDPKDLIDENAKEIADENQVNPLEHIIIKEQLACMYSFLSDKQKRTFKLKYEEGYTQQEIAEILNTNRSTISMQLLRGAEAIRKNKDKF